MTRENPPHRPAQPSVWADRRELARRVGLVVLALLFVAFIVDNSHSVRVGFVFTSRELPLVWVLLVTAVIGAAIDRLARWRRSH